jgi:hypothetical protein
MLRTRRLGQRLPLSCRLNYDRIFRGNACTVIMLSGQSLKPLYRMKPSRNFEHHYATNHTTHPVVEIWSLRKSLIIWRTHQELKLMKGVFEGLTIFE